MSYKNVGEIYAALVAGKKVGNCNNGYCVLVDGRLVNEKGGHAAYEFYNASQWHEYVEPEWYDDIPEGGILCRVSDHGETPNIVVSIILEVNKTPSLSFKSSSRVLWDFATPVSKAELSILYNNALNRGCS